MRSPIGGEGVAIAGAQSSRLESPRRAAAWNCRAVGGAAQEQSLQWVASSTDSPGRGADHSSAVACYFTGFTASSPLLHGYFAATSHYFTTTSPLLHGYFTATAPLLHGYFTTTSPLLHGYFTAASATTSHYFATTSRLLRHYFTTTSPLFHHHLTATSATMPPLFCILPVT